MVGQGVGRGLYRVKGAKYLVTENDLISGRGHAIQYVDHVSEKSTLETYIVLSTNVT